MKDLVTRQDAAWLLGVHPRTLDRYVRQGQLRRFKAPGRGQGGSTWYRRSDLVQIQHKEER
jgi:predicted site-specific integrase-resolvase